MASLSFAIRRGGNPSLSAAAILSAVATNNTTRRSFSSLLLCNELTRCRNWASTNRLTPSLLSSRNASLLQPRISRSFTATTSESVSKNDDPKKEEKKKEGESNTKGRKSQRPIMLATLLIGTAMFAHFSLVNSFDSSAPGKFKSSSTLPGVLDTYYSQNIKEPIIPRKFLQKDIDTDVCVIGGGLAGLATAIGLAERGKKVVLLESNIIGWGASALNGGFAIAGYQVEGDELVDAIGEELSAILYGLSVEAQQLIRKRVKEGNIQCDLDEVGALTVSYFKDGEKSAREDVEYFNKLLKTRFEVWNQQKVKENYKSDKYYHGIYDPDCFTVNPLNLVLGLARLAESKGVLIYERTQARSLMKQDGKWKVVTQEGVVGAPNVVIAGAAHVDSDLDKKISQSVVPVFTYIGVTKPLGEKLKDTIALPHAVCDDRFALNYFRPLPGGRLLWGGFAQTYSVGNEEELKKKLLLDLFRVFPQLQGTELESVWGGTLAFGANMMPLIGTHEEGLWYCTGFGGHGVVPTTVGGELIASAIAENDTRYKHFQDNFPLRWVGGSVGKIYAQFNYWAFIFADEWKLFIQQYWPFKR